VTGRPGSRTRGQGQGHEHRESADTVDATEVARAWLAEDPDPDTRAELQSLLDAGDAAGLADRFGARLEFGTAGLRGALGAGPNRMNRAVVIRAAAGLCSYLTARGGRSVVIGYDARHKSDVFARDTAEVVEGAGMHAVVLPRPLPTPVPCSGASSKAGTARKPTRWHYSTSSSPPTPCGKTSAS